MKVYVDELPEKCEDCVFSETGFVWDSEVRFCKLKPRCMNWIALYDKKRKDCTLCSLTDHDKQVRKEVCEEIQSELLDFTHKYWRVFTQNGKQYMTDDDLIECLNEIISKIQGEKPKQKKFTNYSGWDLINDLVKPCRVCKIKPTICDLYGYPEKYQIACMNCNCTNRTVASDDNFYTVIDLWNKAQGEGKND